MSKIKRIPYFNFEKNLAVIKNLKFLEKEKNHILLSFFIFYDNKELLDFQKKEILDKYLISENFKEKGNFLFRGKKYKEALKKYIICYNLFKEVNLKDFGNENQVNKKISNFSKKEEEENNKFTNFKKIEEKKIISNISKIKKKKII